MHWWGTQFGVLTAVLLVRCFSTANRTLVRKVRPTGQYNRRYLWNKAVAVPLTELAWLSDSGGDAIQGIASPGSGSTGRMASGSGPMTIAASAKGLCAAAFSACPSPPESASHKSFVHAEKSEYELQCELNQPGIDDCTIHRSKTCRLKEGLWRAKLRMVEEVEKFRAELQTHPFGRTEGRSLEYGKIEIDDPLLAKAGIHTRLVSKLEVIRL